MKTASWESFVVALGLVGFVGVAWSWQQRVLHQPLGPSAVEPWEGVRERFPMPEEFVWQAEETPGLTNVLVQTNPFSAARRPSLHDVASGSTDTPPPAPLQFIYKGRIMLGGMPRAILEEVASKKTHFLQVGQAVAGFTLVEMTDLQVVLSNPGTTESFVVSLTSSVRSADLPSASRKEPGHRPTP